MMKRGQGFVTFARPNCFYPLFPALISPKTAPAVAIPSILAAEADYAKPEPSAGIEAMISRR